MTTSITDARYNVLHHSAAHTLSLSFDEPPETGWSVMPGYDESLYIPPHLEPPRLDADETLPSMIHPSYPFGRPVALGRKGYKGRGVGNLLGTVGDGFAGSAWGGGAGDGRETWDDWGLDDVVERERRKEVPPGMAGAKRPPSPPSPALRPSHRPLPRSAHLRHLFERQQQATSPAPNDGFDAPVPNETYEEDQSGGAQDTAQRVQGQVSPEQARGREQIAQVGQVGQLHGDRGREAGMDDDERYEGDDGEGEDGL
ncbi:hypothetical protein IAU60_003295 [Kwoniella sp. DSM 27419]